MLPRILLQNFENCANLPKMHKQENFKTDFILRCRQARFKIVTVCTAFWQFLTIQKIRKLVIESI